MSTIKNSGVEIAAPLSIPVATNSLTSGNLDATSQYTYKVTYINPYGETTPSGNSIAVTTDSTLALNVTIPVSPDTAVTARKVYRTNGNASPAGWFLATTINDNTTTSFTDTLADTGLGSSIPPTTNTAMSSQINYGNCKFNQPIEFAGVAVITANAAGTQALATAIGLNQFAGVTLGADNASVLLPPLNTYMVGMGILINNTHATFNLRVFPSPGQTISSSAGVATQDAAVVQPGATLTSSRWYVAISANTWKQV